MIPPNYDSLSRILFAPHPNFSFRLKTARKASFALKLSDFIVFLSPYSSFHARLSTFRVLFFSCIFMASASMHKKPLDA